jgi:hypothetical protein
MNLGELIEVLKSLPPDMVFEPGLGRAMSYRGYYDQIAFEPVERATVADMLREAVVSLDETFTGYKGGSYVMHSYVECWVAEYGALGEPLTSEHFLLALAMARLRIHEPGITLRDLAPHALLK